jgi:hypothetical protein
MGMVRWESAFRRATLAKNPMVMGKTENDFTAMHYVQTFVGIAMGATTGYQLQNFPAGAFVLGISAACSFARIVKPDQYYSDGGESPLDTTFDRTPTASPGNLDLFALDFQYTQNQAITANGPVLAAALLGGGGASEFPSRELIIEPSQGVLCRAQSFVSLKKIDGSAGPTNTQFPITVHVVYKAMVPRLIG